MVSTEVPAPTTRNSRTTLVNQTTPSTTTAVQTTQNQTTEATTTTTLPSSASTTTTVETTTTFVPTTTNTENTTSYNDTTSEKQSDDGEMPMGAIIGIAVGVCVAIFIVVVLIFIYRRRRRPKPKPVPPKLPSAAELDKPMYKMKQCDPNMADPDNVQVDHESLYKNLGPDGKPTDKTNPNVGDDGYLKKEGKKKGRKKKLRNKFNKKQARNDRGNENVDKLEQNDHSRLQKTISDASYSHGRTVDSVSGAYDSGKVKEESFYENTGGNANKGYANLESIQNEHMADGANYYNLKNNQGPTQIYENP